MDRGLKEDVVYCQILSHCLCFLTDSLLVVVKWHSEG